MISNGWTERIKELEEENEQLRKAVAVKDAALRGAIYKFGNRKIGVYVGHVEYVPLDRVFIKRMERALSSTPSGMVCVSREKLREIEWTFTRVHEPGADVTTGLCPVCEHERHTTDCWLSALIGGER